MDKQTALVATQPQAEKKSYWARMGGAYSFAFWVLVFLLPIFVLVFMALCSGAFTRNSVFGFGKDVAATPSFLAADYTTVSYTYYEGERIVLAYQDSVASVTSGGIEIYSPNGSRLLNLEAPFFSPRAVCSQKYMLAFDFGTRSFCVTSPYAVLFTGETEYPIYGAAVADTGHFALITGSNTHLSQVLLYDANFNLIQRFARDSATTSVTLSNNGKYVAIGGMRADEAGEKGVVEMYRIGIKNSAFCVTLDEAVLSVDFTDDRHICVLGENNLRVLDTDGEYKNAINFDAAALFAFDVSENGCALALCTDPLRRESRVVICDKKGNILYDGLQKEDVSSISLAKEHVFFLCDSEVVRFSWEDDTCDAIRCPDGATGIFAVNESASRVTYAGEARYVEFE